MYGISSKGQNLHANMQGMKKVVYDNSGHEVQELQDYFGQYGEVSIDIKMDPATGRSRGFGSGFRRMSRVNFTVDHI